MKETVQQQEVAITGTGIFKDDRLVGWLGNYETRDLLWLRGEVREGIITVPSPGQPEKMLSFNIIRGNTRVDPKFDGETIRFSVTMNLEGELLEQQSTEDLTTPEKIKASRNGIGRGNIQEVRSRIGKGPGGIRNGHLQLRGGISQEV